MNSNRFLDQREAYRLNWWSAWVSEYTGDIDEAALERAFKFLGLRHPVLRARLIGDNAGQRFVLSQSLPKLRTRDNDSTSYIDEIQRPRDPTQSLASLVHIREQSRRYVMFCRNNSIADGGTMMTLFRELWQLYTDILSGSDITINPSNHLPGSTSQALEWYTGQRVTTTARDPSASRPALCGSVQRHVQLSHADTRKLILAARSSGSSLYAMISGVILMAQRNYPGSPSGEARMKCWTVVDLRRHSTRVLSKGEITGLTAIHEADVTPTAGTPPLSVGVAIKEQITNSLERRGLRTSDLPSPPEHIDTSLIQRRASVMISNLGVIPNIDLVPNADMIALRIPMLGNPALMPMYPCHLAYTYRNCLYIRFAYPSVLYSHREVDELVDRTIKLLVADS